MNQKEDILKQRVEEHFEVLEVLKHNIDGIINVGRLAEKDKGKAVEHYRLEAEKLDVALTQHKQKLEEEYAPIAESLELLKRGLAIPKDMDAFEAKLRGLLAVMEQAHEIDKQVMKLASDIQTDPLLADDISATYSLPEGFSQVPAGSLTSFKLAGEKRKRITLTDSFQIVDFVSQKASSAPVKRAQRDFHMFVISAAVNGDLRRPVKEAATFTPGKAKVAGSNEYSFGYLWEMSAAPGGSKDPTEMRTGYCFMTVNDRDLFSRCYSNGEGTPVDLSYADFIPDEEMGTNLH